MLKINAREYRWGQSKMDKPEKLAAQGTQDEEKQNTTQSRETGNRQGTQDEDKQNKDNPEKLATYRVHKTKTNKTKTIQRN